jgi:N,N'-diacetyllegionaminate synthase
MINNSFNLKKKTFIIAEIGNNHEGSFINAKKLIRYAAKAGVDAVKFQTFITDEFVVKEHKSYNRLKKFELSQKQFLTLKKLSNKLKLEFISTPLDFSSAKFLKKECNIIKIASGDNNFYDLINFLLNRKKKIIISTGMMNFFDIKQLVNFIKKKMGANFLNNNLTLMHCVSSYPAEDRTLNLMSIKYLSDKFKGIKIGYSDHSIGLDACLNAVALGARIVEKHFTLNNDFSDFRDHKLSLDPKEMKKMVKKIRKIELQLGNYEKKIQNTEKRNIYFSRRSIFAKKNIKKNETLSNKNTIFLRPQHKESKISGLILNKKKLQVNLEVGEVIKNRNFVNLVLGSTKNF